MNTPRLLLIVLFSVGCAETESNLPAVDPGSDEPLLIEEEPQPEIVESSLKYVDPFIGTGGVGFAYAAMTPAVQVPFGFVKLGPDTTNANNHPSNVHHFSGYYTEDPHIRGFSHLHFVGTGAADYGNLRVLPTSRQTLESNPNGFSYEPFDKETEVAEPGYYAVRLESGTRAELTASRQVGVHRYSFPNSDNIVSFDVTSSVTDGGVQDASLETTPTTLLGEVVYKGPLSGRGGAFTLYFYGEFSSPADRVETWNDDVVSLDSTTSGTKIGAWFSFDDPQTVEMKVGVSFISVENAKKAADQQSTFDAVRALAEKEWSDKIDRVRLEGDESHKQIFYTALYNAYRMPTRVDEDGFYRAVDGTVQPTDGPHLTDLSLWDTFRTLHPWYTLFDPEAQRWTLNSLLRTAKIGGMLPRWPAATNYSGAMEGTSADILFAESALKGIDGVDYEAAYEIAKTTATESQDDIGFGGRDAIAPYIDLGWIPADEYSNAASNVLEYSLNDFALANLARFLESNDDASMFDERAARYQNIWDAETSFFRPRNRDGSFVEPFDPTTYSERSGVYTEGSAWHWLFYAQHDPEGLAELHGGAEPFVDRLTTFMESSKLFDGDKRLLVFPDPFYWHTNQPSLHVPALFTAMGRRDLGSRWIRQIQIDGYSTDVDGIVGNDDGGTLSAWYLLTAIGLYPQVGTDRYYVNAPIFERIEIDLQSGETLVITGGAVERSSIDSATINGVSLGDVVNHRDLDGALLKFDLR